MSEPLVQVMIPTLNEARHIADVVKNARLLGPVFVLDSLSIDGTQELARNAGATVIEHRFNNYAEQKNWGLDNLPFDTEWVFILDADERITPALRREVLAVCAANSRCDGYFINRQLIFQGRIIRNGGLYPSWNLRLFRRKRARYENRSVHEHMICQGTTDYLKNKMLHLRTESISQYILKHIRYADMESDEWVAWKLGRTGRAEAKALFRDYLKYRNWIRREIWPRVPLRPLWRFIFMYVLRVGFLDGKAGWNLACLMAGYEYTISLLYRDKLEREQRRAEHAREAAKAERATASLAAANSPIS